MSVRIGLIGYGTGGRYFHAPFIEASAECELVAVVTSSGSRREQVGSDFPHVQVAGSIDDLISLGVDAVVISTSPETRRDLVLEAVQKGLHVVADKPFAPDAATAKLLADSARDAGVLLNVFHNRRYDTDIVTARAVLQSGNLGRLQRVELRCDQDDPGSIEAGPQGGLLRDLGSHVVDQALLLGGEPRFVTAHLEWQDLPQGPTDVGFTIGIEHQSGTYSLVSASKAYRLESRALALLGDEGSYSSDYSDVQAEAIFAGARPGTDRAGWGFEREERWGTLRTSAGSRSIPSRQGDYTRYYDEFARAIESGEAGPVPAEQGVTVLRVLDAARRSAAEHYAVAL
ncbi:Gfo/Idh/MocA family protein [Microbacterium sp. MPKO10]|uniref:Gfo/Idh/MocA family protein n=1 Tax=Microbacterium sp. MPKO10 TaxID=2989818 RepID=UPI002235D3F8|nr:Gfo/Idh/MocA family oxidoreductase [Microbacterium sp. MPKO10]MCW4457291.1 Gfo/Idh/MocA family oxidoreductase [Microbacterium sp. MPKO10]